MLHVTSFHAVRLHVAPGPTTYHRAKRAADGSYQGADVVKINACQLKVAGNASLSTSCMPSATQKCYYCLGIQKSMACFPKDCCANALLSAAIAIQTKNAASLAAMTPPINCIATCGPAAKKVDPNGIKITAAETKNGVKVKALCRIESWKSTSEPNGLQTKYYNGVIQDYVGTTTPPTYSIFFDAVTMNAGTIFSRDLPAVVVKAITSGTPTDATTTNVCDIRVQDKPSKLGTGSTTVPSLAVAVVAMFALWR